MSRILRHLNDNKGDEYIWFLVLALITLIMFSVVYTMMDVTIEVKNLKRDMNRASDSVFSDIRELSYHNLMQGKTEFSTAMIDKNKVLEIFAKELDATYENGRVFNNNAGNKLSFIVEDFEYYYYSDNSLLTGAKKGDINGDGNVTLTDKTLAVAYINNEHPQTVGGKTVTLSDVDVNYDGVADDIDVGIINEMIKYYAIHAHDNSERDKGVVLLTFKLTVPIRLGGMSFGDDTCRVTCSTALTYN